MSSQSGTGKSQKSSTIFCQRQLNHRYGDPSPSNLTKDINGDVQQDDHLAAPAPPSILCPQSSPLPNDLTYDISRLQCSEWVDLAALASCAVSKLGKERCVGISELGPSFPPSLISISIFLFSYFLFFYISALSSEYDSGRLGCNLIYCYYLRCTNHLFLRFLLCSCSSDHFSLSKITHWIE